MSGEPSALDLRPDAPVLLVHARADIDDDWLASHVAAAERAYPAFVVLPLHGLDVDADALAGRDVVIWPWMGAPSQRAALRPAAGVLARTAKRVRLIAPSADEAIGPGDLNGHEPIAWAKARCEDVAATPVEDLDALWFPEEPVPDDAQIIPENIPEPRHFLVSAYADSHPDILEEPPPEPVDLFEKQPLPRLAERFLPPSIAPFIFDQSQIIGSDPCVLFMSALVACAAVTSDFIRIQPKQFEHGWKESARLWGAFVGDPSVKKTPPLARATAHLRKLDLEYAEAGAEAQTRYKIALKVHAKAEARWIDAQAKHAPCGPLDDAPERPPTKRIIVQDATIEAVADVLIDNPQGVLVLQDELSGFFGSMDAYRAQGGKDRAFWLEAYNGGPRRIDRIGRGTMSVPNLSVCMLGGIQPAAIRAVAQKSVEDGLLQRFMIVCAEGGEAVGDDRRADTGASTLYRGILDELARQTGDPEKPVLLEPGARDIMLDAEKKLAAFAKLDRLPLRMRYQMGKWSGLFARLCLTYHAIECAALGMPVTGAVAADIAERVHALLFEYLFWHLRHFYEVVIGDSAGEIELLHRVADWILAAAPDRFTSSHVSKGVTPWRSSSWNIRRNVLERLELCGWIDRARTQRYGSDAYTINPRVRLVFAERADFERQRRDELRSQIVGDDAEIDGL